MLIIFSLLTKLCISRLHLKVWKPQNLFQIFPLDSCHGYSECQFEHARYAQVHVALKLEG